ncbi:SH3 domain-containing protein [Candidatus Latescibacterota bacterium]
MRTRLFSVLLLCMIMCTGCVEVFQKIPGFQRISGGMQLLVPGEEPIPGVPAEADFADFWARKHPDPDGLIMTPEEIDIFNSKNPEYGISIADITEMSEKAEGANIRKYLNDYAKYLNDSEFFITGKIPLEKAELERIIALMDTTSVPEVITLRFGVLLNRTMGREWPTHIPLMNEENDNEFDYGVTASLDTGTPVALLHTSKDGRWSFVKSPWFMTWIPSSAIAFGDIETVKEFVLPEHRLVAVGDRISVYYSPEEKAAMSSIQMGSYLPLRTVGNEFCEVLVPGRAENGTLAAHIGYVRRSSDVSIGYLPYTARNVYRQCFTLFGRRYGWGGMYGDRDCSRYVMDVFKCFNIRLPRNSTAQARASEAVISLEEMDRDIRLEFIGKLPGGISLLRMSGHIMIYLGDIDGEPYAISDLWAWREPSGRGTDIAHRVARVAVTDLMLGKGTKKGSYIDRLTNIAILGNYEFEERD